MMLVPPAGWGSAPSPWLWHWALSSSCPSPSSAMRCCSPSPATITSSGSTGPLSMASGTWSSSSPICPLSSSCPLPTSSPSPRALQDPRRGWRCPPLCHPVPGPPLTLLPQGIVARVYKTSVVPLLLTLLVLGMVWVASAIMGHDAASGHSLYDGCRQGALGLMELQQGRTRP